MDAILLRADVGARVVLCGMISEYNSLDGGGLPIGQYAISQGSEPHDVAA